MLSSKYFEVAMLSMD